MKSVKTCLAYALFVSWLVPPLFGFCGDVTELVEYLGIPTAKRYADEAKLIL